MNDTIVEQAPADGRWDTTGFSPEPDNCSAVRAADGAAWVRCDPTGSLRGNEKRWTDGRRTRSWPSLVMDAGPLVLLVPASTALADAWAALEERAPIAVRTETGTLAAAIRSSNVSDYGPVQAPAGSVG